MNLSPEIFVEMILNLSIHQIADSAVFDWLEKAIEKVEADHEMVLQICQQSGYEAEARQEITFGLEALVEYRQAFQFVEDYFVEREPGYLEDAANLALSVQEKMALAQAHNREISQVQSFETLC